MNFKRVLVTDRLAWELFGAAAQEKLLFVRDHSEQEPQTRPGLARQRALSLIILFDRLSIPDPGRNSFRLPDLEKEGIVDIIPVDRSSAALHPLATKWKKGKLGLRSRPPKNLLQSLSLVQQFSPLVMNRILTVRNDYVIGLSKLLGLSRRAFLEAFFDYAIAYAQGDEDAVREHRFTRTLPKDLLNDISEELFDFSARGEEVGPENTLLVVAILFAEEIATIRNLSMEHKVGVATEHYGSAFRSEPALKERQLDAISAANRFLTLRAAFSDGGLKLPRIEGIEHALLLRKNPYLRAMREHLKLFHGGLTVGDQNAVREARREIKKAQHGLRRAKSWNKALSWLTYMAVPVAIAEALLGSPSIVGTSLSVIGATWTAAAQQVEKKSEWVLFGT